MYLVRRTWSLVWHRSIILSIFLGFSFARLCYSILTENSRIVILSSFVALIVYAVLSFYTHKDFKIPTLIMAAIILVSGLWTVFLGIVVVNYEQLVLKIVFILVGLYFCCGGIVLFRNARGVRKAIAVCS